MGAMLRSRRSVRRLGTLLASGCIAMITYLLNVRRPIIRLVMTALYIRMNFATPHLVLSVSASTNARYVQRRKAVLPRHCFFEGRGELKDHVFGRRCGSQLHADRQGGRVHRQRQ